MKVRCTLKKMVGVLVIASGLSMSCVVQEVVDELPEPVDVARMVVEENLDNIDDVITQGARDAAVKRALGEIVSVEAERPFLRRVDDGLRYSTVFQREYVEGKLRARFADEGGLSPRGEEIVVWLKAAGDHGIDNEPFHLERIQAAHDVLEAQEKPSFQPLSMSAREVEGLVQIVAEAVQKYGEQQVEELLLDALSIAEEEGNLPPVLQRLTRYHTVTMEEFGDYARKIAELELLVADGALRYAREMRHANLKRLDWRQMRDAGGSTEVILARMQQTLQELNAAEVEEVEWVFRGLEPSHPQYRALFAATERYRGIAADGGWERVASFTVEEGATSERVEELRIRLETEGFNAYPAESELPNEREEESSPGDDLSDEDLEVEEELDKFDPRVVDQSLIDGIRAYQKTHQFDVDGVPTFGFWRSLNRSVEERIEQMELTLQRWRESYIEDDEDFIMVNIPGFKAEVWTNGERQMNFGVVVGRNNRVCDSDTGKWDYPNSTPILMSEMDHIILNPSWYLPPRLVRESLEPRVRENPDYFEEAGYEEMTLADGREVVRQKPGPDNALGQVKFMFPNEHNVYLHDTPQKHYFDYVIRAFSFGCIRVSEPLELAEHLFAWDEQQIDIDEVLESGRTRQVNLKETLPVITEYYTVWVDDDGLPNFLADIYRKDARRLSEDPEEYGTCTPRQPAPPEPDLDTVEEGPEDIEGDLGP